MIFQVNHTTRFDYSGPVALEPMTIRLRPRSDRAQRVLDFSLHADPAPSGTTETTDVDGNDTVVLWFLGQTRHLELRTSVRAQTLRSNPFDYVVLDWQALRLPMQYPCQLTGSLERFRSFSGESSVGALADEVAGAAQGDGPVFLTKLAARLAELIEGEVRLEGDPMTPAETLKEGKGSCRDVALLFMDACRAMGLAARFVSGYQRDEPEEGGRYLHAWAEVFLPGVGWRGYDATAGLAVAESHLALAAGPDASSVAPTEGSLRGSAFTTMSARIELQTSP
ncbi:MAG: transglutaminase family protein [Actinomycetota bacterium]